MSAGTTNRPRPGIGEALLRLVPGLIAMLLVAIMLAYVFTFLHRTVDRIGCERQVVNGQVYLNNCVHLEDR